ADMPSSDNQPSPDAVDYRFTQVRIQAGSVEDVTIKQITAIQAGTTTSEDLKDIKLKNDTKGEVIATVAKLNSNGRAVFDNLNIPVKKGESVNLSILATLTGGASSGRTVRFELHDGVAYTIQIVGNTYGFGITPVRNDFCATTGVTGGACQLQTVASGTLRVSRASSSPATGKIPQGGTQVPLIAVEYNITGEAVRVTSQNWDFAFADDFACSELTSVTLYNASNAVVAGPKDCASNTVTFTDSMTIPAGSQVYTLKANIASTAGDDGDSTADTVAATLDVSEYTVRGESSGKSTTVSTTTDVTGNTLTLQAAALKVTNSSTPITGSVVAGVQHFTFANVDLDASSGGEDVKVSDIKFTDTLGATADAADLINLELWGDPDTSDAVDQVVRIDTTNATAGLSSGTVTFTFKTPIRVAKSKASTIMLKADVSKSATIGGTETHTFAVAAAADVTSTGWSTGTAITETVAGSGQAQTVRAAGTLKVEVAADSATSGPVVAGSTGVAMAKYKFTASFEDVDLTDIPLYLANGTTGAGTLPNVKKVRLYKDGQLVGNVNGYTFDNNAKVTVTVDNGVIRAMKDVPTYIELRADFNPKEQVTSGTAARVGLGDSDSDASTWGGAGNYNITAVGRDGGSQLAVATLTNTGATGGTVNGGNAFGVFDGILTVGLDATAPSGVQTAGSGKEVFRFWLTSTGDDVTVYDLGFLMSGSATGGDGTGQISGTGDAILYSPDRAIRYADWATADVTQPLDPGSTGLHIQSTDGTGASSDAGTDGTGGWDTLLVVGAGQTKVVILTGDTTGAGGATTSKSYQVRLDDEAATVSGIQWMDTELDNKAGASCPAASTDAGAECVIDSATYTKTLPVNGNGLTYN
ncbi:hypothetical protein HY632_00805, partial [Candidatus Uhrbacteria bacterium]|nr:hypothetical protein [Candidatus Uhrbacteria bacterium]